MQGIDAGRMDHHGGIDAVEGAVLRHQFLAAALFLGGGTEIADAAGEAAVQFRQRQRGAEAGRRDDVVAAGMADAGERVIFRKDRDFGAAGAEARGIGGVEAEGAARDGEVGAVERGSQNAGGLVFVEGQFGPCMDLVADGQKLGRHRVDHGAGFAFQRGGVGHSSLSPFGGEPSPL